MTAAPAPTSNGKMIAGCGGCGCAFALLLLLVGVVLLILGLQPRTDEALPFGIGVLVLGTLASAVSLPILIYGVMQMKSPPPPAK